MPPDTIAVEVHRGPLVESRHAGRVAVARDDGSMVFVWGDAATPVYPRSAIKALQALPLVESGAADAYGFDDPALALACASHNGAAEHVAVADRMLACAGVGPDDLGCGTHWPYEQSSLIALARSGGTPSALHNNCSGKHAGFLALARRRGHPLAGYVTADHPVQVEVRGAVEAMTGAALGTDVCGTDGCSIPTYAIPLDRLALAFARFGTGRGLPAQRAEAARRLRVAVAAHRTWWPAKGASARGSCGIWERAPSSRPARKACSARACPISASASRSNATTGPCARPRSWSQP